MKGYSQVTSEFKTKKGVSSLPRVFSASLSGPAVPRGSVSIENSIRTLYFSSYYSILDKRSIAFMDNNSSRQTFFKALAMISGR